MRALGGAAACAVLALTVSSAYADRVALGGEVGYRATDLAGQIPSDWSAGAAIAGVAVLELSEVWAIGVEPGWRRSGSGTYRLSYLALPVVGHARWRLDERWRLRGSLGVAPSWLAAATMRSDGEGETLSTDVKEQVRAWDVSALLGAAAEWRTAGGTWFFAEARLSRGLATVDRGALFVTNREVGLWIGVLFE